MAEAAAAPAIGPDLADPTLEEYELLFDARMRYLVEVDQPLVLITQAPRSGGSLLMRLFDGHPECHTISHEFKLSLHPETPLVPDLDAAWRILHDDTLERNFRKGFGQAHANLHGDRSRYPMLVPPSLQRRIYDRQLAKIEEPTERDVMNAYLTSFFNGWLDNQNLYGRSRKKWVTAFTPRLIAPGRPRSDRAPSMHRLESVRAVYPDGRLISVVRDPVTWYASARLWSHHGEWEKRERAMHTWCDSVQQALTLREQDGEEFIVLVSFEALLKRTSVTMGLLARHLGIRPTDDLQTPTFNGMPIRANSSFAAGRARVSSEPLERAKDVSAEDVAYIRDRAWDLYESALAVSLGRAKNTRKPIRQGPKITKKRAAGPKAASRSRATGDSAGQEPKSRGRRRGK
jgi:hypothetical protein